MTVGIAAKFERQPWEKKTWVLDLSELFSNRDDVPATAAVTASPGITASAELVGMMLAITEEGGVDQGVYDLTVHITTSDDLREEIDLVVKVKETPAQYNDMAQLPAAADSATQAAASAASAAQDRAAADIAAAASLAYSMASATHALEAQEFAEGVQVGAQRDFVLAFNGKGDDASDNTAAFNLAEAAAAVWIYLQPGTYRTTHLQLAKRYYGPGRIRFADGYLQSGLPEGIERPRSATGPVVLSSPNDLVLAPVGDIQASGRRIVNAAPGVFPGDVATMRNVAEAFGVPQDWTPSVIGATTAGTATYGTNRWGRITRIGQLAVVTGQVDVTSHTGTGQALITGLPVNPAVKGSVGMVLSGGYDPSPGASYNPQTLMVYTAQPNRLAVAFDVENYPPGGAQIDADGTFSLIFSITFEVAP